MFAFPLVWLKFDRLTWNRSQIIFATGYLNMRTQARLIFGDELADRVGGKSEILDLPLPCHILLTTCTLSSDPLLPPDN